MIQSFLQVLLPVFLVVALGYLLTAKKVIIVNHIDGILNFTQTILIPIYLFLNILKIDLSLNFDLRVLLSYYFGSLVCFVLGTLFVYRLLGLTKSEAIVVGFSVMFSNAVLLGLPITELVYGSDALGPNLMLVATQAPFCYLVGITTMEISGSTKSGFITTTTNILKAIFSNNITVSIFFGIVCNVLNIIIPEIIFQSLSFLSEGAVPIALFGLGGILTTFKFNNAVSTIMMIIILSLIFHPLLTLFSLSNFDSNLTAVSKGVVITAAMAPGLNTFLFASYYKSAQDTVAASILFATPISLISTAIWIYIIN